MSAHTRIRPARGLPSCLWRALRICRWASTESFVSISSGDVKSQIVQARKYLCALSRAGIVCRRRAGRKAKLVAGARPWSAGTHPQTLCRCPVRPQHRAGAALWEQQQKPIG